MRPKGDLDLIPFITVWESGECQRDGQTFLCSQFPFRQQWSSSNLTDLICVWSTAGLRSAENLLSPQLWQEGEFCSEYEHECVYISLLWCWDLLGSGQNAWTYCGCSWSPEDDSSVASGQMFTSISKHVYEPTVFFPASVGAVLCILHTTTICRSLQ